MNAITSWGNAPIYYSLVQVIFNNVPNMEEFYPKIANSFKKLGFNDPIEVVNEGVRFEMTDLQTPKVTQTKEKRWDIYNQARDSVFHLSNNSLVFSTTKYVNREEFIGKIVNGLEIISSYVSLVFIDKIGLRYIDLIIPKSDDDIYQYISAGVRGLDSTDGLIFKHKLSETVLIKGSHLLIGKTIITQQPVGLVNPGVLGLIDLTPLNKFTLDVASDVAWFDNDCSITERMSYSAQLVKDKLLELRESVEIIFSKSYTDYAEGVWK